MFCFWLFMMDLINYELVCIVYFEMDVTLYVFKLLEEVRELEYLINISKVPTVKFKIQAILNEKLVQKEQFEQIQHQRSPICSKIDNFCLICNRFTPIHKQHKLTEQFISKFQQHFSSRGFFVRTNSNFAPKGVCDPCYRGLLKDLPTIFKPAVWKPVQEHNDSECFACMTKTVGYRFSTRHLIHYPHLDHLDKAILLEEPMRLVFS